MLIASMNPCPCGYYNHPDKECVCGAGVVQRYLNKISGPLLDRIDLHVEVTPVSFDEMTANRKSESSAQIRERVLRAREVQTQRFGNQKSIYSNAMMPAQMVKDICVISASGKALLKTAWKSSVCRPGPTIVSCGLPVPLPTCQERNRFSSNTWQKPFSTAAWTAKVGLDMLPVRHRQVRLAGGRLL
jgi:hypothetical protein